MADHPIYDGDTSVNWQERPCAARNDEGQCEDAARQIGVDPQSTWTKPSSDSYGWVCSAHHVLMVRKYEPEQIATLQAQLAQEGREFWDTYGEESGEVPRVSRRTREIDSLNSDT